MNIAAKDQNQRSHCAFPITLGSGGGIFRDISLNRVLSWGANCNRRMIEIVFRRILNISCPSGEQLEACWFFSCPRRPSSPSSSARSCVAAVSRSWIDKFKQFWANFLFLIVIRCAIGIFKLNAPNSIFFNFLPRDLESRCQDRRSIHSAPRLEVPCST